METGGSFACSQYLFDADGVVDAHLCIQGLGNDVHLIAHARHMVGQLLYRLLQGANAFVCQ